MTVTDEHSHANGSATNGSVKGHIKEAFVDGSVAISPSNPELVPGLLEQVALSGNAFASEDPKARTDLLDAARQLVYALETPREAMIRFCWSQATAFACLETGVDLGLFTALSKDDKPKKASELAETVGADNKLISRILKHLCAVGVILETGPNEYRRTGMSTSLMSQRYSDAYSCMTACITKGVLALPAQLKKTGYKNLDNGTDCAFQLGYKTPLHFFEFLKEHPDAAKEFNNHMSAYRQGRPSWMDSGFYDVPALINGDIGEGEALLFHRKWSSAPGRLILQDLPEVLEQAKTMSLHPSIEIMAHDFFNEQPVKGARAYYMHSILHDWTDADCKKILENIVPAMKRGHSKILINENVIPETNAYWETTSLDIIMMADFASTERTADDWHALVESAGLKITKIWTAQRGVESLIECELA
ncbi:hypothetical protein N7448_001228 [Penicillium atrosanguineum]|nr:hypothetical protein N7448_001228 [Penicillium atrosanguineum]